MPKTPACDSPSSMMKSKAFIAIFSYGGNNEIKYFSQTKFYRWLQTQREQWTILQRQHYQKYNGQFDAGEYFNTFKMDYMQQAFIIFDHKPPTQQFHEWNNPHPLFTFIQNEIDKQNPKISDMTMQYVDKIMTNISKRKFLSIF